MSAPEQTVLKVVPAPAPQPAPSPPQLRVRSRSRRRWWIATILLLVLAAAGFEAWRLSRAPAAVEYMTAPVTRGAVTRGVTASGAVNPVTTIQVGTYVSGVIQELYCDFNTVVKKGQLCAKIDPRPYQTIVDQDRANLSTAKAQLQKDRTNLTYATLTLDRTAGLLQRGIVSQDTFDAAKNARDQAAAQVELDQASVDQRQASLSAAEVNLGYTDIVSPVNGTVVSRSITQGQTVAASFQTPTLFLIATDLAQMQVDANVSESDIGGIAVGNAATFTVEAFPAHVFKGRVTQVRQAPQTVQNVVTYDVVISVPNPELLLKPGMTATVRIVVQQRENVLRVPDRALRYAPGGIAASPANRGRGGAPPSGVWILRDGKPAAVPITIGLDDDTNTEVVNGALKEGDQVITSERSGSAGATGASTLRFFRL